MSYPKAIIGFLIIVVLLVIFMPKKAKASAAPKTMQFNATLTLKRVNLASDYTEGNLYLNGVYFCDTLEDAVRAEKIKGKTAIPFGYYNVSWHNSPKFGKKLPILQNVPNFEYILIHQGNRAVDTEGCILVGKKGSNGVLMGRDEGENGSTATLNRLIAALSQLSNITIEIV